MPLPTGDNDCVALHAGCDGGAPAERAAGCVRAAGPEGDRPAGDAAPQAASDGAGGAAQAAADPASTPVTPPATVREFERALRGLGFTRKQAADIARHGFNPATAAAVLDEDSEPDETQTLREALKSFARILKG